MSVESEIEFEKIPGFIAYWMDGTPMFVSGSSLTPIDVDESESEEEDESEEENDDSDGDDEQDLGEDTNVNATGNTYLNPIIFDDNE